MKLTLKALTGLSIGMAVLGSAMTGGQGAYDLRELGGGTQAASTQITVSTAALEDLQQARASFQQATMALKDGMLHASTAELVQRDIATFDTSARATLVHLQTLAHDAPAAARTGDLDALTTRIQAVFEAYRNVLARAGAHTIDQGTMEVETAGMDGPVLKAFTAQEQALTALTSAAVAQVAALKTRTEVALIRFVAVGTFAMVIVLGSLFFTMRTIRRSVGAEPRVLCEAAARIAGGDMTRRISGAHGSIAESLESLRQQLGMLVVSVRDQASRMSTATGQIAAGNRNLSTQTSQQAAALEASAATIEQMTQSVGHNADAARVAAQTATECSRTARAGGDSMQTVVAAMADIKASADRITGLLADIDGIAFQTNLLSLNAAVEAARAGESGRGFAVVAQEVRSLAARSSDLAKQIRTLMAASGERIQAGSDSAVEAGRTIGSLVTQVREVTDLVDKIASAVVEQSTGLVQVNSAMSQLDAATQQNAALVEQAHAASDSLNGAAQSLTESVTMFQV